MSTKYRADMIDDLMNRVRQHHEAWDAADAGATDSVEIKRRPRAPHEPVPPPRVLDKETLAERAYDANMRAANWAPSEGQMFGRKGTPKYKVIQSGESRMEPRLPPETPFGHAALPPPKSGRGEHVPGWLRYQMTLQRALDEIDRARSAHMKPTTRGAVAAMGPAPARPGSTAPAVAPTRRGDDVFDKPPEPIPAEPTNPNFRYDTQQMHFWALAPSDDSVAGGSSVWAAGDADLTRTYVVGMFGRPRPRA
jgi:hypothetical protein